MTINEPVATTVCVLYDPVDGRVIHTHGVVTMAGAHEATAEEVVARATERAQLVGKDTAGSSALTVGGDEWDAAKTYRVDPAEKRLIVVAPGPDPSLGS